MECYFGIIGDINVSPIEEGTYVLAENNLLYFYVFGKFQLKTIYTPIVFVTDTEYYIVSGITKHLINEEQFRQYCFPNRVIDIYDEIEVPEGEMGDEGEQGLQGPTGDIGDKGPDGAGISENSINLPYIGMSQPVAKDTIVEFINGNLLPYDYRKTKNWIIEFANTHNIKIKDFVVDKNKNIYIVGHFFEKLYIKRVDGHVYYMLTTGPSVPNGIIIHIMPNNLVGWIVNIPSSLYSTIESIVITKDDKIYVSGMFLNNCVFYNLLQYTNRAYSMFVANITRNGQWKWVLEGRSKKQLLGVTAKNVLAVDSRNNLYVAGYFYETFEYNSAILPNNILHGHGIYSGFLARVTNNGDWEMIQILRRSEYSVGIKSISIDVNDNIYVGGFCLRQGKTDIYLCKYSAKQDKLEWQIYDNSADNMGCESVAAGDLVYIAAQAYISAKDANGNTIWITEGVIVPVNETYIDFGNEIRIRNVFPESILIDDDQNLYISGYLINLTENTFNTPQLLLPKSTNHFNRGFIGKFNWQRKWEWVSLAGSFSTYPCIYIDPDYTIYVLGTNLINDDILMAKIIIHPIIGLTTERLQANKNATVQFFKGTIVTTSDNFIVGAYYNSNGKRFSRYNGYLTDGNVAIALTKNTLLTNIY